MKVKKYSKLNAAQKALCKPMSGIITPATDVIIDPDGSLFILHVRVTPRLARKWAALKHKQQRRVSKKRFDLLVSDLEQGRFQYIHDPIAFSAEGHQVNGNHRLNAIIKSGAPCYIDVLLGVSAERLEVMDSGSKRTVAQQIGMSGKGKVNTRMTSPLSMALRIEQETAADTAMSTPQVREAFERYADAISLIEGLKRHHNKAFMSPGWGAILYAALTHPEAAYEFAHGVCTLEGLKVGSPALAYLNWRRRESESEAGLANGYRGTRKHALATCRCLRAQILGKKLSTVDGNSTKTNGKTKKGPVNTGFIPFSEEDVMKWMYSLRKPPRRRSARKRSAA